MDSNDRVDIGSDLIRPDGDRASPEAPRFRAENRTQEAGGRGEWELFDSERDPTETRELSRDDPRRRKSMLAPFDESVARNGVVLEGDGPLRAKR